MAISFVVETGAGLANATSYLSVEEADGLIEIDFLRSSKWDALTVEADKEKWLVYATRWLDRMIGWHGAKATTIQALEWPRKRMRDKNGNDIGEGVVPIEVKQAVVEVVLFHLTAPVFDDLPFDPSRIRRFRADTFEVEFQDGTMFQSYPDDLRLILLGLSYDRGGIGFKKIKRV